MRVLLFVPVFFLCACGGNDNHNSSGDQDGDDVTAAPTRPFKGGAFFGSMDTGSDGPFVDAFAILSEEGEMRIELIDHSPAPAVVLSQIVGKLNTFTPESWTAGLIIGEGCAASSGGWGCGTAQPIEIRVTLWGDPDVVVELRGPTSLGTGTFRLPLQRPQSNGSADLSRDQGVWTVSEYDLSSSPEVMSVDSDGAIFFQSSATGCTGNGQLAPTGDGSLYSVEVSIGNCNSEYEHLNTAWSGLASYLRALDPLPGGPAEVLCFLMSTPADDLKSAAIRVDGWRE